jgi:hypothetical protein
VIADPILNRRVPKFLERLRADVAAIGDGDFATAITLGHGVERASRELGFEGLGQLGARIENAARRRDGEALRIVLGELAWYVEHVQVVYRRAVLRAG